MVKAKNENFDVIILHTARLNVDGEMMLEIQNLKDKLSPNDIFYIADSMTGQDVISSIKPLTRQLN